MAREFSSKQAKQTLAQHERLLSDLRQAGDREKILKDRIKAAAEDFILRETLRVLQGIPVEELNRDIKRLRTKTLADHHFTTMADLYAASIPQLSALNGISEDNAYSIKKTVGDYVESTRKATKIRLSADDRTKEATALVRALSAYRGSLQPIRRCKELRRTYEKQVRDEMELLRPFSNGFRLFFASKANKSKAAEAYARLAELSDGPYGTGAGDALSTLDYLDRLSGEAAWKDFSANSVQFFTLLEEIAPGLLGNGDSVYGLPEDLAREIQEEQYFPEGLKCTLRRYQEWGVKYILHQQKVLLGDEMGLGKTIQAIAAMVSLKNTGASHFVVVCPASVVTNWCREITRHSVLPVIKVHGSGRGAALQEWIEKGGVAVTTYETTVHFELEDAFRFSLLIVDEAHYIKNPSARRTIHTTNLCSHTDRILFMTGTALENRVDEMITLISFLRPEIASQVKNMAAMASAPQFRDKVAPVYYRRKREDVLTELPDLIESQEWCSMTDEEEQAYESAILRKQFAEARRVSWNLEDLHQSSKANRLKEIVEEAESEDRKIIVFSFFLDTIRKVSLFLGDRCLNPINGSVTPQRRQEIIDEFDKAPAGTVLVAQIQSGGTGLNIQSASVVVICEPQFKPSIENQAISRAYRMGQSRNVLVYRLLCEASIDERITELLAYKQQLFDEFADKSVSAEKSLEIDEKTFGDLMEEEVARINGKREKESIT